MKQEKYQPTFEEKDIEEHGREMQEQLQSEKIEAKIDSIISVEHAERRGEKIQKQFNLTRKDGNKEGKEVILSPDQEKVKGTFIKHLDEGKIDEALKIKEKFDLPEQFVQSAAKESMLKCFNMGYAGAVDEALKMKEKFNLSEEFVRSAVEEGFVMYLYHRAAVDEALKMKEKFNLSEEFVRSTAESAVDNHEGQGATGFANQIRDAFHL